MELDGPRLTLTQESERSGAGAERKSRRLLEKECLTRSASVADAPAQAEGTKGGVRTTTATEGPQRRSKRS